MYSMFSEDWKGFRSPADSVPAASYINDLTKTTNALIKHAQDDKPWTRSEKRAAKAITPFNNMIGVGYFWNRLIDGE